MAVDPSIYAAFLRPPRSAVEYAGDFQALDTQREATQANALQRMLGQAKLDEYGRQTQQANALQQLYRGMQGKTEPEVAQGLRAAGYHTEAGTFEKGMLDRNETRAKITGEGAKSAKEQAQATKAFGEAQGDALKRYRGALDFIDTPQGAQRWLQAQYSDPLLAQHMQTLGPIEQAMSRLPQDPQGFEQWRQKAGMGMEAWMKQRLEQDKANDTAAGRLETARLTERGQDITARGQNMTDARSREAASATQFIPVENVGLYAGNKKTGQAQRVTDQATGQPIIPQKAPPQFAVEGAQAAIKATGTIDKVLAQLETPEGRNAVGLKNMAPGAIGRDVVNRMDPAGVEARAGIADVGSLEIKNRSGATVTVGEEPRLMPFIPVPTDSADVAKKKLKRLRETIQQDYEVLGEFYPGVKKKGDAAAARTNAPTGLPDDIADLLKKHGGG